jgi:hypothetical protein
LENWDCELGIMQPWTNRLLIDGIEEATLQIRPEIKQVSLTSVQIIVRLSAEQTATKYVVTRQRYLATGALSGSLITDADYSVNSALKEHTLTLTGLVEGGIYVFTITPYNVSAFGNKTEMPKFYMEVFAVNNSGIKADPKNPAKLQVGKSYLQLTNTEAKKSTIVSKDFPALQAISNTWSYNSGAGGSFLANAYSISAGYFTFGTSIKMTPLFEDPIQGAGIGFFMDEFHKEGYALLIQTIPASIGSNNKTVRIVKIYNGGIRDLSTSQKSLDTTLDGIYGGKTYNIDIKVKFHQSNISITAYINGFKITASDNASLQKAAGDYKTAAPTNRVALICTKGTAMFDYVFASKITSKEYLDSQYSINFYQGQFSNDILNNLYGDYQYLNYSDDDEVTKKLNSFEEFGTTVREIVKREIKFDSRPSVPVRWSTGANPLAKIISQKYSNFGGEAYVLNNSSTTIPLADGIGSSFYLFGNTIGDSGTLEYITDEDFTYGPKEPIVFESRWLQTLDAVKELATWIKEKVVNRGKIVNLTVFGNPMLNVGDIVSVASPYQDFDGTEKLIVTSVTNSFNQGLETTVTCRTL